MIRKCVILTLICSTISLEGNALGNSANKSDPNAEQLWNKCIKIMRAAKSFDADFIQSFKPDNSLGKAGHIHVERSGRIGWSFRADHCDPPRRVVMKSDGKKATVFNTFETSTDHYAHAEFYKMFINAFPVGVAFYDRDGFTRYRSAGTPIKSAGVISIGKEQCSVIEVTDNELDMVTRFYIGPNGMYRGHRRASRKKDDTSEAELRLTNVRVGR